MLLQYIYHITTANLNVMLSKNVYKKTVFDKLNNEGNIICCLFQLEIILILRKTYFFSGNTNINKKIYITEQAVTV